MLRNWFTFNAAVISDSIRNIFLSISTILVVGGALIVPLAKRQHSVDRWTLRWLEEWRVRVIIFGLIGLLILFFNTQKIQAFGARVWFVVWGAAVVVVAVRLWRRRAYWDKRRREDEKHAQLMKYLTPKT